MSKNASASIERIAWSDIASAAQELFNTWVGNPEIGWARQAWKALRHGDLTSYTNELEKQRVLIRLMVLAIIYIEFCEHAWGEAGDPWIGDWSDALGLSPFRIGQLVGHEFAAEAPAEDSYLLRHAVVVLIMEERDKVVRALVAYYGDYQELFVALMASNDSRTSGKRPGPSGRGRILNSPDAEGLMAYQWVTSGLEPSWYPSGDW